MGKYLRTRVMEHLSATCATFVSLMPDATPSTKSVRYFTTVEGVQTLRGAMDLIREDSTPTIYPKHGLRPAKTTVHSCMKPASKPTPSSVTTPSQPLNGACSTLPTTTTPKMASNLMLVSFITSISYSNATCALPLKTSPRAFVPLSPSLL